MEPFRIRYHSCAVFACLVLFGCSGEPQAPTDDGGVDVDMPTNRDGGADINDAADPDLGHSDAAMPVNPSPCDPIAQDCVAEDSTCAFVIAESTETARFECRDLLGTASLGESCELVGDVPGVDSCAGLYCASWGLPATTPQERACFDYCSPSAPCEPSLGCLGMDSAGTVGMCVESCDPRDDQCPTGTKCGSYLSSVTNDFVWTCDFDSGAEVGDECRLARDCGAGQRCAFETVRVCRSICYDGTPCAGTDGCLGLDPDLSVGTCRPVDWSCVGSVVWPAPTAANTAVDVHVLSGRTDVDGATINACAADDVDCTNPFDTQTTGVNGRATLMVPNGSEGFDGYFEVVAAGFSTGLVYAGAPFTAATGTLEARLFPADFAEAWPGGLTVDSTRGSIVAAVEPCMRDELLTQFATGVGVTLASNSSDALTVTGFTTIDEFEFLVDLTETSFSGIVALANHPAGVANLTFSNRQPTEVARRALLVRAGAVTYANVVPTP